MKTKFFGAKSYRNFKRIIAATLLSTMWLTMTGCASFDLRKPIPWGTDESGVETPPGRLSAVWTDTIMTQPDKPAMRGFGGRIMFFDTADEPIKTAGTMEVYAWDETDRDPANPTPDRKFVFHAQDFEKHYSKGRLGHSYSFWIPWDEVGGKQTQISLMVKFSPTQGAKIIGEQSKHILPGVVPTPAANPLRDQLREQLTAQQMLNQQRISQQMPQPMPGPQMNGQQFYPQQNGNQQPVMMPTIQNPGYQQMNGQAAMQTSSTGQQMMYDNQVMTMSYDQNSGQQNMMHSVMQNSNDAMSNMQPTMQQNQPMNQGMQSGTVGPHGNMETFEIPLKAGSPLARTGRSAPQTLPQTNQPMQQLNNSAPMQYPVNQMQPSGMNGQMMNNVSYSPGTHTHTLQNRGGESHSMDMRQKANAARHERIVNGLRNTQANNPNGVTVQANGAGVMQNAMMQNAGPATQSNMPMQNSQMTANQNSLSNGNGTTGGYNTTVSYGPISR